MSEEDIGAWSAEYIRRTIEAVTRLTGAGVCLYGHLGGLRGVTARQGVDLRHESPFCAGTRALPGGRDACILSDVEEGMARAQALGRPFMHVCHAGLCEVVVPIMMEDTLIGAAYLGQCRLKNGADWPDIARRVERFGRAACALEPLYRELPEADETALWDAAALMDNSFRYLVSRLGKNALSRYLELHELTPAEAARQFIDENFCRPIGPRDVADCLHVTPAHLTRLFRRATGEGVADYIARRRIERACELLASSGLPIGRLSVNVGFSDQNYFSRRFRRGVGLSPSAYRAQARKTRQALAKSEAKVYNSPAAPSPPENRIL